MDGANFEQGQPKTCQAHKAAQPTNSMGGKVCMAPAVLA